MDVRAMRIILSAFAAALCVAGARAQTPPSATYEYVYPYNTPDLVENHFIVLDGTGDEVRGWYYGTSDEFDQAREGYLPGFFVASMADLRMAADAISFTLARPSRFFTAPVPRAYRDASDIPPGSMEEWSVVLTTASRDYVGTWNADTIELRISGGPRVFRRASSR
jgi:hypothetical protein